MATRITCDACGDEMRGPALDLGDDGDYCRGCIDVAIHAVLRDPKALAEARDRFAKIERPVVPPPDPLAKAHQVLELVASRGIPLDKLRERLSKGESLHQALRAELLERHKANGAERAASRANDRAERVKAMTSDDARRVARARRQLRKQQQRRALPAPEAKPE
jgi:hypothetical protein